jgi:hypothetical protein
VRERAGKVPRYVKKTQRQIIHGTIKRRAGRPAPEPTAALQLDLFREPKRVAKP